MGAKAVGIKALGKIESIERFRRHNSHGCCSETPVVVFPCVVVAVEIIIENFFYVNPEAFCFGICKNTLIRHDVVNNQAFVKFLSRNVVIEPADAVKIVHCCNDRPEYGSLGSMS